RKRLLTMLDGKRRNILWEQRRVTKEVSPGRILLGSVMVGDCRASHVPRPRRCDFVVLRRVW
ncbi:MAG: hypothetical protein ABI333_17760, partial [bacterium]